MLTALLSLVFLTLPLAPFAQPESDADPESAAVRTDIAPIKVDGEIIFYVRGISSFTAQRRAAAISKRIVAAASQWNDSTDTVIVVTDKEKLQIFAGRHFIMNVYDADASREGIKRSTLAELNAQKIELTVSWYRSQRSGPVLVRKAFHALGALILLVILMFGTQRFLRWLHKILQSKISARVESMESKSFKLIQSGQIWKALHLSFHMFRIAIFILLIAIFLQYVLSLFPWTNSIAVYVISLFLDPILTLFKGFLAFIPNLAFLIVIYFVTRYLLKLVRLFFSGVQKNEIHFANFKPEWAMPTYKILRLLIIVFALIIAYPYIPGSETSAFKGVTVFLGILLSLGSSSVIGNMIAGYSITYRGAFKIGDWIQVNDNFGMVEDLKLMVTRLRTLKNEEIIIPNSLLMNSNVQNFSTKARDHGLILHTTVGIGYETPWRQVEAMLKLAAGRTDGMLKAPPPFVLQLSLGDFAVVYELNVFCESPAGIKEKYTRLHQNILDVFNENNVQIMTPAYEKDPKVPKVVPPDQWDTPLARNQ
jgi:small-conductance mechanosensitive channel